MDKDTITALYNKVLEPSVSIEKIFNKWFGEDKVDFQYITLEEFINKFSQEDSVEQIRETLDSFSVFIYFGTVDVTNENGNSERIYGLIAKINIRYNGTMYSAFTLNRHIYTPTHLNYDYMHSHVNSIPYRDASEFQHCCLGSGPIRHTIATLNVDCVLNIWELFCVELQRYVETESLRGGPYHRLGSLGKKMSLSAALNIVSGENFSQPFRNIVNPFLYYIMTNAKFKYVCVNGVFVPAMSPGQFIRFLSKSLFEFNKTLDNPMTLSELLTLCIIKQGIVENETIKTNQVSSYDWSNFIGQSVCDFKGKTLRVELIPENKIEENKDYYIINNSVSDYIWSVIILTVNALLPIMCKSDPLIRDFYGKQENEEILEIKCPRFV